jgi:hypothetical protein
MPVTCAVAVAAEATVKMEAAARTMSDFLMVCSHKKGNSLLVAGTADLSFRTLQPAVI